MACRLGFCKARWFPVLLSILLILLQIIVVSSTTDITAKKLIIAFAPVLAFAFYIIYTAELIKNMNDDEPYFLWFIIKKMLAFIVIACIILFSVLSLYKKNFMQLKNNMAAAKAKRNSPTKKALQKKIRMEP